MMKKFAAVSFAAVAALASTSALAFFDDKNKWEEPECWYNPTDCNPYDEWDPRYWMEEFEQMWDDDDDYMYGPMMGGPMGGYGMPYGRPMMPYGGGYGMPYGGPMMGGPMMAPPMQAPQMQAPQMQAPQMQAPQAAPRAPQQAPYGMPYAPRMPYAAPARPAPAPAAPAQQ